MGQELKAEAFMYTKLCVDSSETVCDEKERMCMVCETAKMPVRLQ